MDEAKAASWLEPVPLEYRRKRARTALAIGLAVAAIFAGAAAWGDEPMKAGFWALLPLFIGSWRYRAWMDRETVRRYAMTTRELDFAQRLRRSWGFLAYGFGFPIGLLAFATTSDGTSGWWVLLMFLPFGLVGLYRLLFARTATAMTPAAAHEYKQRAWEREGQAAAWTTYLEKLVKPKVVRYSIAALLVYCAYLFAQSSPKGWVGSIVILIWACIAAWEVALWLIGAAILLGLGTLLFQGVAALPVSVAVIVGAIIIAGALKK